jgi:hypothetical protein
VTTANKIAFEIAAGKDHHTLVDAIWGYTQFLLGPQTRRMLVLYEVRTLRMAKDAVRAVTGPGSHAVLRSADLWDIERQGPGYALLYPLDG